MEQQLLFAAAMGGMQEIYIKYPTTAQLFVSWTGADKLEMGRENNN